MTRITNADQVLALLRNHLDKSRRTAAPRGARQPSLGPIARARALASENVSEDEIGRALIAGLLTEEFGPTISVEPRFQAMVDDIHRILRADKGSSDLLRRAIDELSKTE